MKNFTIRKSPFLFLLFILLSFSVSAQITLTQATFTNPNGTTSGTMSGGEPWAASVPGGCPGPVNTFSVQTNQFTVVLANGFNCANCTDGSATPPLNCGDNQNLISFGPIDISGKCNVGLSAQLTASGSLECGSPGGPPSGTIGGGHDQITCYYSIDGGPDVLWGYMCGNTLILPANTGNVLTGNSILLKIYAGNQNPSETYRIDNVRVTYMPKTTPTFTPIGPLCEGSTPPSLPSSSTEGITGTWSPPTINTSTPGTVTYTFTPDDLLCYNTATLNVTIDPKATPVFALTDQYCEGSAIPDLPLTSDNGISGVWSPAIDNMNTTTYTFTPSAGECANSTTFTINITPTVTPDFLPIDPLCLNETPPPLSGTSPNGVAGTWVPAVINTSSAGTANYVFTPNSGQCATGQMLTVTVNPLPVVSIDPVPDLCSNDAPVTLTGNPAGGIWSGPGVTGNTLDPSVPGIGTFSVTYTYTDANGCSNTANDSYEITLCACASPPSTNAGPDDAVCANESYALNGTLTNTSVSTWSSAGDGTFGDINNPVTTYTPGPGDITAGTVTLSLSTPDPDGPGPCTGFSDDMILTVHGVPVLDFPGGISICPGECGNITLSVSGGTGPYESDLVITSPISYSLPTLSINGTLTLNICYQGVVPSYNSATNTLTVPTTVPPGTISFGLTRLEDMSTGCTGILSGGSIMTITLNASPAVTADPQGPLCNDDPAITLTGNPAGGTWSGPGVTGNTFDPAVAGQGDHTLTYTYTDANGCDGTASIVVEVDNCACPINTNVSVGPDLSSCGTDPVSLTGVVTNGTGYFWQTSGTGTFSDINTLNTSYTPSAADLAAGQVVISLIVPDPDGPGPCTMIQDQLILTLGLIPQFNIVNNASICVGDCGSVSLDFTSGSGPYSGDVSISIGSDTYNYSVNNFTANNTINICYQNGAAAYNPVTQTFTVPYHPGENQILIELSNIENLNNNCLSPATEQIIIPVFESPVLNLTEIGTVCINEPAITLAANPAGGSWSGPGVTSGIFTPASAGTGNHTLTYSYTDANGCSATASISVTVENCGCDNPATVDAGPDFIVCPNNITNLLGSASGPVTWSGTGSGSFGDINDATTTYIPSAADFAAGTITLTLTVDDPDGPGPCTSASDQLILTFPSADVQIDPVGSLCEGAAPVSLTGTPAGGTFSGPGVVGNMFDPAIAGPGDHIVKYQAFDNGCPGQDETIIHVQPVPTVDIAIVQPLCADDPPVSLLASPTGGTFSGPGISGNVFDPGAAGVGTWTITYTYSDGSGCIGTATQDITVSDCGCPDPAIADAGPDQSSCGSADITLNGSVTTSALWSTSGSGTFSDPNSAVTTYTPSAADIAAGGVVLTLISTDPDGAGPCVQAANSMTVTFGSLTVQIDPVQVLCTGSDPITLNAQPAGGLWSGTGVSGNIFDPFVSGVGTFPVTYTATDASGCTGSQTINIIVDDLINVTLSPTGPFCVGDASVTLSGGSPAGGNYYLNGDLVNPVTVFDPNSVGTFTVTYIAGPDGCSNSATISIIVNDCACSDPATADAGPDQIICADQDAGLSALVTGVAGGTWTTSGDGSFTDPASLNTIYTPGPADIAAGSVTLHFTSDDPDGAGPCHQVTSSLILTINSIPDIQIGPIDELCTTDSPVNLTATPSGGTFSGSGIAGSQFSPALAGIGDHKIYYTAGTPPCIAVDSITISVTDCGCPVVVTVDAGKDTTVCQASDIRLNAVITGVSSGSWSTSGTGSFNDPGLISAVYTPSVADISSGSVILTFTSVDPDGAGPCQPSGDNMKVSFEKLPDVLLLVSQPTCSTPQGSVKITVISGQNLVYSVDNGQTFTPDQTISGLNPGTYQLLVKNTLLDCQTTLDFKIQPVVQPTSRWSAILATCSGQEFNEFTLEETTNMTPPLQATVNGVLYPIIQTLPYRFDGFDYGNYTIKVTDSKGCSLERIFNFVESERVSLHVNPLYVIDEGEDVTLHVEIQGAYNAISWTPATYLSCDNCQDPIARPDTNIIYSVVVTDENGCSDDATIEIRIRKQLNVFIPNVISPNYDGVNDNFTVYTDEDVALIKSMKVFNRWGGQVFSRDNFSPNDPELGWNGTFRGREMNPGVFVYLIELLLKDGEVKLYKGDVTLIR